MTWKVQDLTAPANRAPVPHNGNELFFEVE